MLIQRISISLFFILFSISVFSQNTVFPKLELYQTSKGHLQLSNQVNVQIDNANLSGAINASNQLNKQLNAIQFVLSNDSLKAQIRCKNSNALHAEGYQIIVSGKEISINYADYNGLLYAFITLNQLIDRSNKINCCVINDAPRFSYRGTHLDCSRHFFEINEIKEFVDQLALLKINRFHWHLTDDQGWRIEIKKYPLLTSIGAFRDSTLIGHVRNNPPLYEKKRYGGFYTQNEIKELVEYCQKRGITIVPEIELPGHARAALAAYPQFGCSGKVEPVASTWGVFNEVFCSKDETLQFLKDVLDEVMQLFPSETIHVGGDEVPKTSWKSCSICQKQKANHGLKDEFELQRFIIEEMEKHLRKNGRNLMGWDEILEGGLAENAQVMSWRGVEGGIEAANSGHYVVMTPGSHCYFDHYQSVHPDEQLSFGGYTPLSKVLEFEPIPENLPSDKKHFILGAQANLWTEYLPEMSNVEINAFPRLVALAEVLWSKDKRKYDEFVNDLMLYKIPRLDLDGIHYSKSFLDPNYEIIPQKGSVLIQTSTSLSGQKIISPTEITLQPSSSSHVHTIKIESEFNGQKIRNTEFQLTTHLAIGKKINFKTEPKDPYTFQKEYALTNGITGSKPWKGKQWLGFTSDTIQFTIDLEAKTKFNKIQFQCLDENNSWIYLPKNYQIFTSNDGINFKLKYSKNSCTELNSVSKKMKTRYIKFVLIQDKTIPLGKPGEGFSPWTFIDEIILTND